MRWTGWIAVAAGLLVLAGCGYGFRTLGGQARYSAASRPESSYFCYDCHGYRYFDPYYDFCETQGFRYRWANHPRSMIVYRDRYVRIKEAHPDYGRYRYRQGYQATSRYREPQDYAAWRGAAKPGGAPAARQGTEAGRKQDRDGKDREKDGQEPGKKKERKGDKRKGPRDGASRPTLPGGES